MNEETFQQYMLKARAMGGYYSAGYQRGLRRHYYGETFCSPEEHEKFMSLGGNGQAMSAGYRHGFAGYPPELRE